MIAAIIMYLAATGLFIVSHMLACVCYDLHREGDRSGTRAAAAMGLVAFVMGFALVVIA